MCFVWDCEARLSRFSLSMHMHEQLDMHLTAAVSHIFNERIYNHHAGLVITQFDCTFIMTLIESRGIWIMQLLLLPGGNPSTRTKR